MCRGWLRGKPKNLRLRQGITQIDLQMLSKCEKGDRMPTIENLIILADYFGTSTDYLMELTDQKSPYPRKG